MSTMASRINKARRRLPLPLGGSAPVSYTHLDVYKRQVQHLHKAGQRQPQRGERHIGRAEVCKAGGLGFRARWQACCFFLFCKGGHARAGLVLVARQVVFDDRGDLRIGIVQLLGIGIGSQHRLGGGCGG